MKKIFFFIMMLFSMTIMAKPSEATKAVKDGIVAVHDDVTGTVSTVYNDGKEAITTLYNDGKEVLAEVYPEVKEAITYIAKALGVAAEHVYITLTKKFLVDGIAELGILLLGMLLFGYGWYKMEKYIGNRPTVMNSDGTQGKAPIDWKVLFPVFFLGLGIFVCSTVEYREMVVNLFNPEWGAINYILDTAKTLVH